MRGTNPLKVYYKYWRGKTYIVGELPVPHKKLEPLEGGLPGVLKSQPEDNKGSEVQRHVVIAGPDLQIFLFI